MTYDPDQRLFFGYVSLFGDHNDELGYFSLDELTDRLYSLSMTIENLSEMVDCFKIDYEKLCEIAEDLKSAAKC